MGLHLVEIIALSWSTLLQEDVLIHRNWGSRCFIYRDFCNMYGRKETTAQKVSNVAAYYILKFFVLAQLNSTYLTLYT
jgi:hypothetical protein